VQPHPKSFDLVKIWVKSYKSAQNPGKIPSHPQELPAPTSMSTCTTSFLFSSFSKCLVGPLLLYHKERMKSQT